MAETTHLICAHCGSDASISNSVPPTAVLTLYETSLAFNCPECGAQYPLPVTVLTPTFEKEQA